MLRLMDTAGEPYYSYSRYLRARYGTSVYRVGVDAGFSCPHRGPDRLNSGCSFCAPDGARAPYLGEATGKEAFNRERLIAEIQGGIGFLKSRYRAEQFILYFQAYSNTNAPASELKLIYDTGLCAADFRELVVSTRPDCIDEEKARLLGSYRTDKRDVWVELGCQSLHDATLARINRGHSVANFLEAFGLLKKNNLKICVHLIFGLPGEGRPEILDTVNRLAPLKPDGVKIHNLHVVAGTRLADQYGQGEVTVPGPREHRDNLVAALELLPPETVIMRLTCDTPAGRLIAPRDFPPKHQFLQDLKMEMKRLKTYQGKKRPIAS